MNRRLKMSMFAVLLASAAGIASAIPGGVCGLQAGCSSRPNFTRCVECCYAHHCEEEGCRQACWNWFGRFKPGTPNRRLPPLVNI